MLVFQTRKIGRVKEGGRRGRKEEKQRLPKKSHIYNEQVTQNTTELKWMVNDEKYCMGVPDC